MGNSNRDLTDKLKVIEFLEQQDIYKYIEIDSTFEKAIDNFLGLTPIKQISINEKIEMISARISEIENDIVKLDKSISTFSNKSLRAKEYKTDTIRTKLRSQIKESCLSETILLNENDYGQHKGGMVPVSKKPDKNALMFLLIGGPGSGKSSYAHLLSQHYNAYLVDSDLIKVKFPEYGSKYYSASMLHEESVFVQKEILKELIPAKRNVIVPLVGKNYNKLRDIISTYEKKEYKVIVILFSVEKGQGMLRALKRFLLSSRYVPLSYVYDECGHESIASFYRIAAEDRDRVMLSVNNDTNIEMKGSIEFMQNADELVGVLSSKLI